MIVAPLFDEDVDMEVALVQHDLYYDALWIIVLQCNRYTEFARRLLDNANLPKWVAVDSFDHRTLQRAHDLLAAVWRFRNNVRQLSYHLFARTYVTRFKGFGSLGFAARLRHGSTTRTAFAGFA